MKKDLPTTIADLISDMSGGSNVVTYKSRISIPSCPLAPHISLMQVYDFEVVVVEANSTRKKGLSNP